MQAEEAQLGVINLIMQAGAVVQVVMLMLFVASVGTWAIILLKRQLLRQAKYQNEQFLRGFWGGWSVEESFTKTGEFPLSPIAKCFQASIRELRQVDPALAETDPDLKGEILTRSLRKASAEELSALEYSLSWLATTASASPFIGLFGTVWGIMHSFQSIAVSGNANLAAVAPGISEALIATAIGLAAAIPASIGYNFLLSKIRSQSVDLESFSQDLLNLLQRKGVI